MASSKKTKLIIWDRQIVLTKAYGGVKSHIFIEVTTKKENLLRLTTLARNSKILKRKKKSQVNVIYINL